VHRDVKPSNLFLCTTPDGRVDVRVCDFGAAKIFGGQQLTHAGAVVGTPLFIAPEQLRSARDADARADVWSLGMSLYFALAGVAALEHVRSFGQLVTVLTTGDIPHLQKAAPWVPAQLARVVHATLLVKPEARCPSVMDLAAALARLQVAGDLATSAIVPLDEATRAAQAEAAALPTHWSEVVATLPAERTAQMRGNGVAPAPASASASAPASARPWIIAVAVLLVVLLGAALRLVILRP